jgi:CopG family transcriptional regulator/antitoxin EndoAI
VAVRTTKILNVSLPPEMYEEIEQMAREESRTKSELMREAFRQYRFNRRWRLLRRWGEETALRLGVQSDDDVERLAG